MNKVDASKLQTGSIPFALSSRSAAWQLAAVVAGTCVLTASSYIEVPMVPVPMTLQTLAVTVIGALYGWRLAGITVVAWLLQGALGAPVLAGGTGGIMKFVGPTAGYLFAFPVAAMVTGWLAQRGWDGRSMGRAFGAMLIGNALCLALGAAWLSVIVGLDKAIWLGVAPFIVGMVVKSALGAAILKALAPRG